MGFSKEELQAQYGRTVPDLVGPGCRLLFVGINPGRTRTDRAQTLEDKVRSVEEKLN